jgi:4-hydroxybenzoate polyprenyltransferase
MWKNSKAILKLCYTPYSIFSPFPFFAILIYLLAQKSVNFSSFSSSSLISGIAASMLSSFASNIWNHTNDLKDDSAQGKINALTQNIISQKAAILLSLILYIFSIIIFILISIISGRHAYLFFLVWVLITWWYSDRLFLTKIFGFRLKNHYLGEFLTYSVAYPIYTLSIWLIYSDINSAAVALAFAFLSFGISVVLIKDLKDISGDRKANLRTFGVVFPPFKLFHYSCIFLFLYYIIILLSIANDIFSGSILLIIIPFFYFIKSTFLHFTRKEWKIGLKDTTQIKTMVISTYISILLLGIGALF